MITLYKGRRGSGKSLTMVKDALKYYQNGWRVMSNIKLAFGEQVSPEYILSLSRSSDLYNTVLVIDEIEVFFDSRNWKKDDSKNFSYFLQQVRKRKIVILCTAQYTNLVEIRLRQQVDRLALPNYNKHLFICSCTYIDLTSFESDQKPSYFIITFKTKPIFNLYDTTEMVL